MITFENAKIQKNIQNLKENSIEIGKLDKNTLSFSVNNKANDDSMLVMSLIYDRNWEVSIDGEKVMCENINGGLLGIPVTTGQHNVVLKYRTGGLGIGSVISFTTFAFLGGVSRIIIKVGRLYETEKNVNRFNIFYRSSCPNEFCIANICLSLCK